MTKARKPWTPEARARHAEGVQHYQQIRETLKLIDDAHDALKPFAEQHGLNLAHTVSVYIRAAISLGLFATDPTDKKFIDRNFQESFIDLVKQRQAA